MADSGWIEQSGEGHTLITLAGVAPNYIAANIGTVTSPRVRLSGGDGNQRVQYGGSAGWATNDDDAFSVNQIEFVHGGQLEFEHVLIPAPGQNVAIGAVYATHYWWKLPPGITWWIRWFWT